MAAKRVTTIRKLTTNLIARTARASVRRNRMVLLLAAIEFTAWNLQVATAQPQLYVKVTVSIEAWGGGTISPRPGDYWYRRGTTVPISATPESCNYFVRWEVSGGVSVANPTAADTTMTVTADGTLCAHFASLWYTVTLCDSEHGRVSRDIFWWDPGEYEYTCGTTFEIEAHANDWCHQFKQWNTTGGVTVADPAAACTIMTINGNGTLCPEFENIPQTVTVCDPTDGTVSPPPGDNTYGCCLGPFPIRATPAPCYKFKEWDCSPGVFLEDPRPPARQ